MEILTFLFFSMLFVFPFALIAINMKKHEMQITRNISKINQNQSNQNFRKDKILNI